MIWSTDQAHEWYKEKGWILGFNYVPSTAVNSIEMWQSETFDPLTIERELSLAAETGFNSCRIFLPFIVWRYEGQTFLNNFERFLCIATAREITAAPVFFDDCIFGNHDKPFMGKQPEPMPGIHNSGWTPSPGLDVVDDPANFPMFEAFVKNFVDRYKNDERILFWDLYNEVGNRGREEKSLPLLRGAFTWARECKPSQPLTTAAWSWHRIEGDNLPVCDRESLILSDIISFHRYVDLEATKDCVNTLKVYNRPLVCTEWMSRPNNSTFETHLPYFKENHIGTYSWGLVNGKSQTHLSSHKEQNENGGPPVWQHDVFTKDLKPYSAEEVAFIKKISGKFK
jgi:hypothetical protein